MKAKLTLIAISAGILLSGAAIYSCARASASEKPLKSAALFDSFSYKGMDDFYESNPLPDDCLLYTSSTLTACQVDILSRDYCA